MSDNGAPKKEKKAPTAAQMIARMERQLATLSPTDKARVLAFFSVSV